MLIVKVLGQKTDNVLVGGEGGFCYTEYMQLGIVKSICHTYNLTHLYSCC